MVAELTWSGSVSHSSSSESSLPPCAARCLESQELMSASLGSLFAAVPTPETAPDDREGTEGLRGERVAAGAERAEPKWSVFGLPQTQSPNRAALMSSW